MTKGEHKKRIKDKSRKHMTCGRRMYHFCVQMKWDTCRLSWQQRRFLFKRIRRDANTMIISLRSMSKINSGQHLIICCENTSSATQRDSQRDFGFIFLLINDSSASNSFQFRWTLKIQFSFVYSIYFSRRFAWKTVFFFTTKTESEKENCVSLCRVHSQIYNS